MALEETFEFRAALSELDQGLDLIHRSVDGLREATGRDGADARLLRFEIALAEIGGNVLTHGRPSGSPAIDYELRYGRGTVVARFSDYGPPATEHLARQMPGEESEDGRGLALARSILDELGYERDGRRNRWCLVMKL